METGKLTSEMGKGIKSTRKGKTIAYCNNCKCGRYSACGCMKKKPKVEVAEAA